MERERSPAVRSRAGPAQRGRRPAGKAEETPPPPPGEGEEWACPVKECQDSAAHPLDECKEFKGLSVTQRRKALKEWDHCECCLTDCPDGQEVLPSDPVSAASSPEAGGAAGDNPRQGLRTSATTTSRGDRWSGPRSQGRSPQEAQSGQQRTRMRPGSGDPAAKTDGHVVLPCSSQEQRVGLAQGHQESAGGRDEDHASGSNTVGTSDECHRGVPGEAEAVW